TRGGEFTHPFGAKKRRELCKWHRGHPMLPRPRPTKRKRPQPLRYKRLLDLSQAGRGQRPRRRKRHPVRTGQAPPPTYRRSVPCPGLRSKETALHAPSVSHSVRGQQPPPVFERLRDRNNRFNALAAALPPIRRLPPGRRSLGRSLPSSGEF